MDLYGQIKAGELRVTRKSQLEWRFWKTVDKNGPVHPVVGQCWVWLGYKTKLNGYGQIGLGHRNLLAHRLSWELHYGTIPDGLLALHRCDNKACVNPAHLFLGTVMDNYLDMVQKGRQSPPKGERHAHHKLTTAQVVEIRRRYRRRCPGSDGPSLGREFGVKQATVSDIVLGKHWKHVEMAHDRI